MEIPLNPHARSIVDAVGADGGRVLVVGGCVRDALLGLGAHDVDLEVYGLEAVALEQLLRRCGFKVNAVGRAFGVLKATSIDGETIDVSLPRRENKAGRGHKGFLVEADSTLGIEEAAARRDFTINAMAWDPVTGVLIDPFGGAEDLEKRILRHVGPAFAEDPLRVLRGMQFAGRFGLEAAPDTIQLAREMAGEQETLALERIWAEWQKWAGKSVVPSAGLRFLEASGWIEFTPELELLIDCPQDPAWHPEGSVWTHTLLTCDRAAEIAQRDRLDFGDRCVLMLSALCHDLGKPSTTTHDEDGHIRSKGHPEQVQIYDSFLKTIGCPASYATRIAELCRRHFAHIGFAGSKRAVRRLARVLGEHGETIASLVRLIEADHAARPPLPGGLPESALQLLQVAEEVRLLDSVPRRILLGRHLMEEGVEPGPEMGKLLSEAYEVQLDGAFFDLEGALQWFRSRGGSPTRPHRA